MFWTITITFVISIYVLLVPRLIFTICYRLNLHHQDDRDRLTRFYEQEVKDLRIATRIPVFNLVILFFTMVDTLIYDYKDGRNKSEK